MKRLLSLVFVLALALTMLASCDIIRDVLLNSPADRVETPCKHVNADGDDLCDKCEEPFVEADTENKVTHYPDGICSACYGLTATEGIIYEASADGDYAEVIGYTGSEERVVIASIYNGLPVKSIRKEAFKESALTDVVIPCSITEIGEKAFYDSSALGSATINGYPNIGRDAFWKCHADLYTEYENGIYAGSSDNRYKVLIGMKFDDVTDPPIHEDTEIIGEYAFFNYTKLKQIVIPDSVAVIGAHAFFNCHNLKSVTIGNAVRNIGTYAFGLCKALVSVEIGESVRIISDYAFYECPKITDIVIPDSVTSIGEWAFWNCSGLTSVVIGSSVTSIGDDAFYNCEGLTSVVIPDSVTSIGSDAFSSCGSLKSVVIPDSVTSIGSYAFSYCYKLTIYCEAKRKPEGWNSDWSYSIYSVVWGYVIPEE